MVIVLSHFVSGHTMREQNMPANSSETYIIWQSTSNRTDEYRRDSFFYAWFPVSAFVDTET